MPGSPLGGRRADNAHQAVHFGVSIMAKHNDRCGPDAPRPRTIQRVRRRLALPRLPKRAALYPDRDVSGLRTSRMGSLHNRGHLQISPSTIQRMTRALHDAMHPPAPPAITPVYDWHHRQTLAYPDQGTPPTPPGDGDAGRACRASARPEILRRVPGRRPAWPARRRASERVRAVGSLRQ